MIHIFKNTTFFLAGVISLFAVVAFFVPAQAEAANRFWVGGTGNWDASDTSHWSTSSGGSGGASVPTANDSVTFDANSADADYTVTITAEASAGVISFSAPSAGNLTLAGTAALNVYSNFTLYSGMINSYTGTITFSGGSLTITNNGTSIAGNVVIGTDGWNVISNEDLTVAGNFTMVSGGFSSSGTLSIGGNFTRTGGSFSSSTTKFNGTGNQTIDANGTAFTNVTFDNDSNHYEIVSDIIILGNMVYDAAGSILDPSTAKTITVSGNVTVTGSGEIGGGGNNLTIDMTGNSKTFSIASGSVSCKLLFSSTSATTFTQTGGTFSSTSLVTIGGSSHTMTASTNVSVHSVTINAGNTLAAGANNLTLAGTLNNSGTLTGTGTWDITDVTNQTGATISATTGNFNIRHNFTNDGTFTHNNGTVLFNGSTQQTLDANGTTFKHVTFNNDSNHFDIQSAFTVAGNFVNDSAGSVLDPSVATTLTMQGNVTISGSGDVGGGGNNLTINMTSGGAFAMSAGTYSANLKFSGTATTYTFNQTGGTFGALSTVELTSTAQVEQVTAVVVDALTLSDSGTVWVADGFSLTTNDNLSNNGTIKFDGDEAVVSFSNTMDTDSGTVEYLGNGGGASSHALFDFGSPDYYHLIINSSSDTITLGAATVVAGNLSISSGTLDVTASNHALNVAGNWTNGSTFTARAGTVTLNGVNQTVSGTTTFYNLTKSETTDNSTNKTLTFTSGITTTIGGTLALDGLDSNDKLLIRATGVSAATISFTGSSTFSTTGYLDVEYNTVSDSSSGITVPLRPANSADSGNTINWFYNRYEGFVLDSANSTGLIGVNVSISVNGGAIAGTTTTSVGGTYMLADIQTAAGDVLTLYIDGETEKGVTVTLASGSNQTNVNIRQDYLTTRCDNSCSLSNANLNTANNNGDTDIDAIYTGTTTITTASGKGLYIPPSHTFAPANPIVVAGDFGNSGTFTHGSSTVTLTGTSTQTLATSGSSLYNLTINGSGGTYTLQDALTVANNLTITAGTLDTKSGSNYAVNVAGNWANSGTFTPRSGTVTLNGVDQTISGTTTFYNLTKQETTDNTTNKTLTFTSGTTQTITHTLTLDGLDANDKLAIRASTTSAATVDFTGSSTFSTTGYLDVEYNTVTDNSSGITLPLNPANSTDSGNTVGWFDATAPVFDQVHYRFYSNSSVPAGLNSAEPLAAEDTNYNVGVGVTFRLRIQIANTGDAADDIVRRLEFKEDSGSWTQITTNSNNIRLSNSANFTDGDATTARLTSTGSFVAGQGKDTGSDTSSVSLANGEYIEDEFSLILQAGAAGHAYSLRITNAGAALDTYTVLATINSPDNTPPVPSGFNPATSSTIKTNTPKIYYSLDEQGDCKASTTNASYSAMSGSDCTGDGSTSGACVMPDLGSNGSKTIYFACRDIWGNEDTISTTHSVTYTLSNSTGQAGSIIMKGLGKIKGLGVFR